MLASSMMLSTTLAKPTGCDLSQDGDVSLSIIGYASSKQVEYKPAHKVGKNFKELFVGATMRLKDALVTIKSITSNKRAKGKARTGIVTVNLQKGSDEESIEMPYHYLNGYFEARGKQKNSKDISFSLNIKALLCYSK